jgi:hypothetical protein
LLMPFERVRRRLGCAGMLSLRAGHDYPAEWGDFESYIPVTGTYSIRVNSNRSLA